MPDLPVAGVPLAEGVLWRSEPDAFTLDAPGLARFHVSQGHNLQSAPAPGAGDAEVRLLAHGLPQAAAWVQRGLLVLHAAAVSTPGGALALAGPSWAGKSVLAAALARRGAALLADEVLPVELRAGQLPLAHPCDPQVLLWRRAAEQLGYDPEALIPAREGLARYWLPPLPAMDVPQPLARLYLLGVHNQPGIKLEPLRGHARVMALMRHAFNRRLAETPARRQQTMLGLAALPRAVRVARLWRPELGWSVEALLAALDEDRAA
jgi:hypothetical protein